MLGFKPIASLKPHHNLREPTMLYPDEKRMPGSTPAFIALHGQVRSTSAFIAMRGQLQRLLCQPHSQHCCLSCLAWRLPLVSAAHALWRCDEAQAVHQLGTCLIVASAA